MKLLMSYFEKKLRSRAPTQTFARRTENLKKKKKRKKMRIEVNNK